LHSILAKGAKAMNLNRRPTVQQLKSVIAGADDQAGCHVIWVSRDGTVNLTTLRSGYPPSLWAEVMAGKFRFYFTVQAGEGYVGVRASNDNVWMRDLLAFLRERWSAKAVGCVMG
jgi:hypothetical protein